MDSLLQIEPIVALKDRGVVHHMVLYICKNSFNDSHLNATGGCYDHRNMPPSIIECAGVSPMFAWAVGGVVRTELDQTFAILDGVCFIFQTGLARMQSLCIYSLVSVPTLVVAGVQT